MKKTELESCPQWLLDADTENEDVEMVDGILHWNGGTWNGCTWYNGIWNGGTWNSGTWNDGIWRGGTWFGGTWFGGEWRGGTWFGGVWGNGIWKGGVWHGGEWYGSEDRLLFMAGFLGIIFKDGYATAYRTTRADGGGRWNGKFIQPEGEWYEEDVAPAGSGTCVKGIHVTSASKAWIYFGVIPEAQMWEVRFKREDFLDCDGQKARIRGGIFTKIDNPF